MKRKALVAVLVLAVAGGGFWAYKSKKGGRRDRVEKPVTAVEGPIERTVDATGSILPLNRVEIKPPIGGRVEQLLVQEGSVVKAGEIVAWISSHDRAAILDAARARGPEELAKWQDAYKPTPILSPLDGTIILSNVVVGETISNNSILFAVADKLIVNAQVDESDIGKVKVGMPARVTLDAYPGQPVEGKVFDILYEGKNVSNVIMYGVKVKLTPVPSFFRSQMTANVGFILARKEKAVVIPLTAVQDGPDGSKRVSVPGPDGQPQLREVTLGIESGESVEVVSGLNPGDQLVSASGKYVPQSSPQSSPLAFGGRRRTGSDASFSAAPRQRRKSSN